MFAALGTKVTVDEALKYHLRGLAVAFRFSETIKEVQRNPPAHRPCANPARRSRPTSVEHTYAVGDVIGFPPPAATSTEQGRRAASHA